MVSTWPTGWLLHFNYFLSLQEAINKRWEETFMAASQDLPTEEEEGTVGEVIPSEREGSSPVHQNFEEALFGWAWALKDSDESVPSLRNEDSISPSQ